jgi:two-component system, response regulator YesN
MYKIILIDDEKIVIEGLRKLVKWEKFGFELAGCFTDGIEGSAKIRQTKPDVVISDIRMPGMDGLSMIEQIKNELPYTVFIIISGYTDFQYAKKALNLGVIDYIDKPITIEKVTAALERIKATCEENNIKKENLKQIGNIGRINMNKAILEYMYSDDNYGSWFLHLNNDQKDMLREVTAVCVVSGFINKYSIAFDNIIEEVFEKKFATRGFTFLTVKKGESFTGVLLICENQIIKADIYKAINKCKADCCKKDINITLGASQIYDSTDKLRICNTESVKALRYARFKSADELYIYDTQTYNSHLSAIKRLDQESVFKNLRLMDEAMVTQTLKVYLSMLCESDLTPDMFSQECLKLVFKALDEAKHSGYDIEYKSVSGRVPHEELKLCRSYGEITEWTISAFKQIIAEMMKTQDSSIYKPISKVKDYLERNFQKDISLNDVAKNIGFNPAYLSVLFKEEIGTSFVKYLTNLRLEYAKRMLEEGYKVVDISKRCGFSNYRYFCDTFKRYNGITPNEYKLNGSIAKKNNNS